MKKDRNVKAVGTPNIPSLESLEARQMLSAIAVGVTTALPLATNDTTPALVGTVGDNMADVQVTLKQGRYSYRNVGRHRERRGRLAVHAAERGRVDGRRV